MLHSSYYVSVQRLKSEVLSERRLFKLLRLQGDNLRNVLLRIHIPMPGITFSVENFRGMCKITFSLTVYVCIYGREDSPSFIFSLEALY